MACSTPPIYWSTGIQHLCSFMPNGSLSFILSVYLKKYHDESTKVSIVSVSRLALPEHSGHFVLTKDFTVSSGLPFPPNFAPFGRTTGSSSSGTGTIPHFSQ